LIGLEGARRMGAGSGPTRGDAPPGAARNAAGELHRRALARRLGLDGAGWIAPDSFVCFGAAAWYPRMRWGDVKGFAYSQRPPKDLVADLDRVIVSARERGDVLRWHRPLETDWYLFREIGGGGTRWRAFAPSPSSSPSLSGWASWRS